MVFLRKKEWPPKEEGEKTSIPEKASEVTSEDISEKVKKVLEGSDSDIVDREKLLKQLSEYQDSVLAEATKGDKGNLVNVLRADLHKSTSDAFKLANARRKEIIKQAAKEEISASRAKRFASWVDGVGESLKNLSLRGVELLAGVIPASIQGWKKGWDIFKEDKKSKY